MSSNVTPSSFCARTLRTTSRMVRASLYAGMITETLSAAAMTRKNLVFFGTACHLRCTRLRAKFMRPGVSMDGNADTTAAPEGDRATPRAHVAAALVAVFTTILLTWPLAAHAGHCVLRAIYFWDAYTNAMIMGSRVNAALGHGPLSLYDDYYFAPLPRSIAFNENLFGLSILFAPFYLLGHNPLWAYNLTLLLSLALSVFFTYLLVLHL